MRYLLIVAEKMLVDADTMRVVWPIIACVFGWLAGRITKEHTQDKRITLLEECIKGEMGIHARLRNIEAAVTARHADVPFSGHEKRAHA